MKIKKILLDLIFTLIFISFVSINTAALNTNDEERETSKSEFIIENTNFKIVKETLDGRHVHMLMPIDKENETEINREVIQTVLNKIQKDESIDKNKEDLVISKDIRLPVDCTELFSNVGKNGNNFFHYNKDLMFQEGIKTVHITNMTGMFKFWPGKIEGISNWGVSKVTDMSYMFSYAKEANPDTGKWDVSNVENMSYMFQGTEKANPDTSKWDVSKVTNMSYMFSYAKEANPDTGKWDVSNVENMSGMFQGTEKANPDTSKWDVSKVTNMSYMFSSTGEANPDTSKWNVSNVENMSDMFQGTKKANPDTSKWDVSKVTNMSHMFHEAFVAKPHTSNWNVSKVTDMSYMFYRAVEANPDTGKWDVSKVTNMSYMFSSTGEANPDTSKWDVSKVTNMSYMFSYAKEANPDTGKWDVSNVENMSYMFSDTGKANPDVSNWNVSKVKDMSDMFFAAFGASKLDVSKWDVSKVKTLDGIFTFTLVSSNIDISNWKLNTDEEFGNELFMRFDTCDIYDGYGAYLSGVKKLDFRSIKNLNKYISLLFLPRFREVIHPAIKNERINIYESCIFGSPVFVRKVGEEKAKLYSRKENEYTFEIPYDWFSTKEEVKDNISIDEDTSTVAKYYIPPIIKWKEDLKGYGKLKFLPGDYGKFTKKVPDYKIFLGKRSYDFDPKKYEDKGGFNYISVVNDLEYTNYYDNFQDILKYEDGILGETKAEDKLEKVLKIPEIKVKEGTNKVHIGWTDGKIKDENGNLKVFKKDLSDYKEDVKDSITFTAVYDTKKPEKRPESKPEIEMPTIKFKNHEYVETYPVKAVVKNENILNENLYYIFTIENKKYKEVRNEKIKEFDMDVEPIIKNERTMLPLRYVAEALRAKVEWNSKTRTAKFIKDGLEAEIQIDTNEIIMSSGEKIKMDSKPLNINSRILVPVVNIANVFKMTNGNTEDGIDQDIEWNKNTREVIIYVKR